MDADHYGARASLDIGIAAQGSQQLVVMLGVLAGICTLVAAAFMWFGHGLWPVPVLAACALVWVALRRHAKSQPTLDTVGAATTRITSGPEGFSLETSPATLADREAAAALERIMANIFHRQRLPVPDGVVGPGQRLELTEAARHEAQAHITTVNQQADARRDEAIKVLSGRNGSHAIEQPNLLKPAGLPEAGRNVAEPLTRPAGM